MFEPMAMNQQQFGALPSARRSGTSGAVTSAVLNKLLEKKEPPPPGGEPSSSYTGTADAFASDNMAVPKQEGELFSGKYDSPAPSQVQAQNPADYAFSDVEPQFSLGDSNKAFQAADMNDQFNMFGKPERRERMMDAQKGFSLLSMLAGGK